MGFKIEKAEASFTRPNDTTAYASGDLIANSTTAGSVVPLEFNVGKGGFQIHNMVFQKNGTGVTNATHDLEIFCGDTKPTNTAGDNAAFTLANCPKEGHLSTVVNTDIGTYGACVDGATIFSANWGMFLVGYAETGHIWMFLRAKGAYTPAANEVFTVTLYYSKL